MQLSTPGSWSHELCEELGYFYTQELPADTKALQEGILTGREFWQQTQMVYGERRRAFDHLIENFDEGFLFFYFTSVDQNSHMLWRYMDPDHPSFEEDELLRGGLETIYRELDEVVGRALQTVDDDTTFVVMSDHGFAPFYWQVNLNSWLLEKGYVTLRDPAKRGKSIWFGNVDWTRTQAFAVGLNGLYVNLKGRERHGIVNPGREYEELLDRLETDLLELVDPRNEQQVVSLVVRSRRDLHGPLADDGPDMLVGYSWGYRSSWKSPLGEFPEELFLDNTKPWSGDHSMDYRLVPGVLIANRPITLDAPALYDLTVAILDEYGIPKPKEMIGRDCLGDR
jgi:predicted AlkP superfamily phosphohydrolase/phosphomutase